ncbi:hypothetical protein V144x_55940 [Gimesia aquarii]|uniref:Uncharacterized protein n=1 Tax=Gimesia aquarii TaxID=2527964 RepID=A0A517W4B7_9PLAN|nr:hypothetical protein V144x_55940 [Gimesia aquarii]
MIPLMQRLWICYQESIIRVIPYDTETRLNANHILVPNTWSC